MQHLKFIAVLVLGCSFIAGCCSRRCCKCPCHQQQTSNVGSQTAISNSPVAATLSDIPTGETAPVPAQLASDPAGESMVKTWKEERRPTPATKPEPRNPQPEPVIETKAPESKLTAESERQKRQYGHAKDYSWIIGTLQRVHVPGGEWKIRYLPVDQIDQWGGSMVLAPDIRLEDFEDGDIVRIEGTRLDERPSLYLTGPLYRIDTIRMVDEE